MLGDEANRWFVVLLSCLQGGMYTDFVEASSAPAATQSTIALPSASQFIFHLSLRIISIEPLAFLSRLADWPRHYQLCRFYNFHEAPLPSSLEPTPASTIIHSDARSPSFLSFSPSTTESPVPRAPLTHNHQHNDVERAWSLSPTVSFSDHDRHRHRYRYPRPRRVSSPILPSYGARSHATNGSGASDSRRGTSFARRQHSDGDLPDYVDEGWCKEVGE